MPRDMHSVFIWWSFMRQKMSAAMPNHLCDLVHFVLNRCAGYSYTAVWFTSLYFVSNICRVFKPSSHLEQGFQTATVNSQIVLLSVAQYNSPVKSGFVH